MKRDINDLLQKHGDKALIHLDTISREELEAKIRSVTANGHEPGAQARANGSERAGKAGQGNGSFGVIHNREVIEETWAEYHVLIVPQDKLDATKELLGTSYAVSGPLTPLDLLKGRIVVIWPQNGAEGIATRIKAAGAAEVRVVEIPADWPADWTIRSSADDPDIQPDIRRALLDLLDEAKPWKPSAGKRKTTRAAHTNQAKADAPGGGRTGKANGKADASHEAAYMASQPTAPRTKDRRNNNRYDFGILGVIV